VKLSKPKLKGIKMEEKANLTPPERNELASLGPKGICTFCRTHHVLSLDDISADIAVLGIPFDGGTANRPGHRFGPRSVREASMRFNFFGQSAENRGYWDMKTRRRFLSHASMVDCGDIHVVPMDVAYIRQQIEQSVKKILNKGAFPVILGGDHSLSYPVVRAFGKKGPLGLIHFDAHLDRREPVPGVEDGYITSGSPIRGIGELEFIENVVSIGMTGIRNPEKHFLEAEEKGEILIPAYMVRESGIRETVERIPSMGKCYVTIDMDVFDSAIAPGVGSPEVEGMDYSGVKGILFGIAEKSKVVGFDVVSVNPYHDPSGRTPFLAAQLIIEFLGAIFG
jgi:agmatinase